MRFSPAAAGLLAVLGGCNTCQTDPRPPREGQPNVKWCPGSPGCLAEGEAEILAGAARRSILPRGFEIANPHYLKSTGCDPFYQQRFGVDRCGELPDGTPRDCGTDGLCVGDPGYTAEDADGSQGDGEQDWFYDCGLDRICPQVLGGRVTASNTPEPEALRSNGVDDDGDGAIDEGDYPGPDEGEGDRRFQAAWIAGFGNNRPALGVLDDVDVRCFALRTNATTTVHCVVDTVGFFYDELARCPSEELQPDGGGECALEDRWGARTKLRQRHPEADVDYLSMSSTHTHESVDTMGQWGRADPVPVYPGRLAGHNDFITTQLADAAAEAVANLRPARLLAWTAKTGAAGFVRDSRDPQVVDDAMTLVEAQSLPAHEPIFTLVHWSNHPEVLSDDNNLLSSDYAALLRQRLEQGFADTSPALPGRGGLAIYVNGTVGGLMTPLGVAVTDRAGTEWPSGGTRYGRLTAYAENLALKALQAMQDQNAAVVTERGEIKVKAEQFYIPVKNRVFIFAFATGLFDRSVYDVDGYPIDTTVTSLLDVDGFGRTEAFTFQLGPFSMASVPGELFPEVAVGGYDGTYRHGKPLVRDDYCPSQESCGTVEVCPLAKPDAGWPDCDCAACRLCTPPNLAAAPTAPFIKDRLPGEFRIVVGLGNDELGYMVPPYDFITNDNSPYFCDAGGDHYEETNSTGPDAVPTTEAVLDKLMSFEL
ncbi:MAG: hypothetical protein HY904_14805 [Deltaproteobacteria bacterium]|nr:hypothetical protein [Deltaproteobacteria bacterium]